MNIRIPKIIVRVVKFGLFSATAFALDMIMVFCFLNFLEVNYLLATGLSFVIAHSLNYAMNRKWNFNETPTDIPNSYARFIGAGLVTLIFILTGVRILVGHYKINYLIGRTSLAIMLGFFNFGYNYFVSFKMGSHLKEDLNLMK